LEQSSRGSNPRFRTILKFPSKFASFGDFAHGLLTNFSREDVADGVGGCPLHVRQHMRVDLERQLDLAVPEPLTDDMHRSR
jgi:hypothetical protein